MRHYSDAEVSKAEMIMKYLEQGFKYDTAYEKAAEELQRPRLV